MYKPVIIIGAPRSGTNMLRDLLIELSEVGTWPCDEINYIWRHGNVQYPSDEFTPQMASPEVRAYISKQFDKIGKGKKLDTVVEKTCANSLRVGFVNKVIPDAKYIFIVRDGMDVVASALKRWKATLNIPYVLRKTRYVPPSDLPYYASRYLLHRLYKLTSNEKRLARWGPVTDGMDALLEQYSLPEVCALQWKACVENAERDLSAIPAENILRVKYEEFVNEPVKEFARLAYFLNKQLPNTFDEYLHQNVRKDSVGKGRAVLGKVHREKIKSHIADTLATYGYQ
ncbi:Sulfotransferase [Candidatus Electrothrix laxa]